MNTVLIWILVSIGSSNTIRPSTVIHKFPDNESCQQALVALDSSKSPSYKCIPAKMIIKKELV